MAEKQLWKQLREKVGPYGDLTRIENLLEKGTPDVNGSIWGVDFWLELKEIDGWPVRPATPVRIDHYTKEQRLWLRRRTLARGRAFLLLRVGKHPRATYLLFSGPFLWESVGGVTRMELEAGAVWRADRIDAMSIIQVLTGKNSG